MAKGRAAVTVAGGSRAGALLADRYRLEELLGRGGMAEVYAAIDERLRRPVAVKLLRPELAADPTVRGRFEAEARAAARLSHPNVVAVFDTGEDEGTPYIVMERLPGDTLADRLPNRLDTGFVMNVAGDVLGALGAAHAAGIVHRDVKPANILMNVDGCAKVADFGIAKSIEADEDHVDLTRTEILIGTPAYLAPERIDGHTATPASDLYSLGVVLYEALSGSRAFTGSTPMAVATAVKIAEPTPLSELCPDLPPRVLAAVTQAMATEPAERFASATAMATALGIGMAGINDTQAIETGVDSTQTIAVDATVSTAHPGRPAAPTGAKVTARPRRPNAGLRVAAVLAALVVVVLAGMALADSRDNNSPGAAESTEARIQLAGEIREWAGRIETGDGSKGPEAADRLRAVAQAVEDGGGGPEASSLLADVTTWRRDGLLFRTAASRVTDLLSRVPGVQVTATTIAPTTVAPPTTEAAPIVDVEIERDGPREKPGKKKDDDDD